MTIVLDHTIVPTGDRHAAARFLADLLGVDVGADEGPFVPVRINDELTLDFDDRFGARAGHYAFRVDEATFDRGLALAGERGHEFGSSPRTVDHRIGRSEGVRRVYVRDPGGIAYELLTAPT